MHILISHAIRGSRLGLDGAGGGGDRPPSTCFVELENMRKNTTERKEKIKMSGKVTAIIIIVIIIPLLCVNLDDSTHCLCLLRFFCFVLTLTTFRQSGRRRSATLTHNFMSLHLFPHNPAALSLSATDKPRLIEAINVSDCIWAPSVGPFYALPSPHSAKHWGCV